MSVFELERYVHENEGKDKNIYPWCYSVSYDGYDYYGTAKTKEEAIRNVRDIFDE